MTFYVKDRDGYSFVRIEFDSKRAKGQVFVEEGNNNESKKFDVLIMSSLIGYFSRQQYVLTIEIHILRWDLITKVRLQ